MGSIIKKIVGVCLSVALAGGLLPSVALADTAGNVSGVVDLGIDVSEPLEYKKPMSDSIQAETTVSIMSRENLDSAFSVKLASGLTVPSAVAGNDAIWVETAHGSASGADDSVKANTYTVQWQRAKVVDGAEGSLEMLTRTASDTITASPDGNPTGATGADVYERFIHYLINDDFDNGDEYNYYVTITDTKGTASADDDEVATTWSVSENNRHPVKVSVGSGNMYVKGAISGADGLWSVSTLDDVTDSYIRKYSHLDVTPYDTVDAQEGSDYYKQLVADALAADPKMKIAGVNGATDPATTGAAAWNVSITDVSDNIYESNDAFRGRVQVTLNLTKVLGLFGGTLPEDFSPENYDLINTGGSGVAVVPGSLEFEQAADSTSESPVYTGVISFFVESAGGVLVSGALGGFALVTSLDEGDATYTIDIEDCENGRIVAPVEGVNEYLVGGTPPLFRFVPSSSDYEVTQVIVRYDDDAYALTDPEGNALTSPLVYTYANGKNSFTFDESITGQPWSTPCSLAVTFSKKQTTDPARYKITIAGIQGDGIVRVNGTTVSEGGAVELDGGEGKSYDIECVGRNGYELKSLARATSANGEYVDCTPVGTVYQTGELTQNLWFAVVFDKAGGEEGTTYTLSVEAHGGDVTCVATFSQNQTSIEVKKGQPATISVRHSEAYVIKSAVAHYMVDGQEAGTGVCSFTDGTTGGTVDVASVTCDTRVEVTFAPASGSGTGSGAVDLPELVNVTVAGIRSFADDVDLAAKTDNVYGPATSLPALGVHQLSVGCKQAFAFYYYEMLDGDTGKPLYWVIDHLDVTYGDMPATRKVPVEKATNNVELLISDEMSIVAVLRAPTPEESESGNIVGPGDDNDVISMPSVSGGQTTPTAITKKDPDNPGHTVEVPTVQITVPGGGVGPNGEVVDAEIVVDPDDPAKAAVLTDPATGEELTVTVAGPNGASTEVPAYAGRYDDDGNVITKSGVETWYVDDGGNLQSCDKVPFVDAEGNIVGNGGVYDPVTGVWEAGGRVVPNRIEVIPGCEQVLRFEPNNSESENWYWAVDEVLLDGTQILPSAEVVNTDALYFDPETSEGFFWATDDAGRKVPGSAFRYTAGLLTLEDVDEPHTVAVSFERAVELDFNINVNTSSGKAVAPRTTWTVFKNLEGRESLRLALAPVVNSKIEHFYIDTEEADVTQGLVDPNKLAERDRVSHMKNDVSDKEWAQLRGFSGGAARQAAGQANEQSLVNLSSYSGASLVDGLADQVQQLLEMTVPSAYAATSDELSRADARSYTLDPMRDYFGRIQDESSHLLVRDEATGLPTLPFYAVFSAPQGGNAGGNVSGGAGPGTGDQNSGWTLTASVASGQGTIDGQRTTSVTVADGQGYTFHFAPAAGWQVVRVTDNGVQVDWTTTTYTIKDVHQNHEILVDFAMVATSGDNSSTGRVLRRITAMLKTGDAAMPLAVVCVGVALGALGVALLVTGRPRKRD